MVAATMGTPADVIKTRVMNQPTDPKTGTYLLCLDVTAVPPPRTYLLAMRQAKVCCTQGLQIVYARPSGTKG